MNKLIALLSRPRIKREIAERVRQHHEALRAEEEPLRAACGDLIESGVCPECQTYGWLEVWRLQDGTRALYCQACEHEIWPGDALASATAAIRWYHVD